MSFVDDTIWIFQGAGLGLGGVDLLIGPRAKVDPTLTTLVVTATGSGRSETVQNSPDLPGYVAPTAQVACFAREYAPAETKIQQAYDLIYAIQNQFVNSTWWRSTVIAQEPFPLSDETGLIKFVFNFMAFKRTSPATS